MCEETKYIKELLDCNRLDEALALANRHIYAHADDSDAIFLRGKIFWKLGNRSKAMIDFAVAAELNPSGPAAVALDLAGDIENYFNKDMYNP